MIFADRLFCFTVSGYLWVLLGFVLLVGVFGCCLLVCLLGLLICLLFADFGCFVMGFLVVCFVCFPWVFGLFDVVLIVFRFCLVWFGFIVSTFGF